MRIVIAFVFGCALMFAVAKTHISEPAAATEMSCQPQAAAVDVASPETNTGYKRASQCVTYCAGGLPACVQGCCACAS
jgi:hypothetical protein